MLIVYLVLSQVSNLAGYKHACQYAVNRLGTIKIAFTGAVLRYFGHMST